jgi:hypothetical protein
MLEVAFILHRQSPVAYDTLRDLIALPSRPCLQTHFRELMEQQVRKMTSAANAEDAVREHLERHPTPHIECVFAGDAPGLSGSAMRQKAGGGGLLLRIRRVHPRCERAGPLAACGAAWHRLAERGGTSGSEAD